jgi:hypothetical protein
MSLLALSLNVDPTAAADADSSGAGSRPTLPPVSIDLVGDCVPAEVPRLEGRFSVLVDADVTAEGKAVNLTFAKDIEPWQEAAARCVIERATLDPATQDGVPVASQEETDVAMLACYPVDRKETATPRYRVTVNVRGWPSQVMLVKTSGDKELDAAGACVLKKLRYEPAKRGERPVMSTLLVPVTVGPPDAT